MRHENGVVDARSPDVVLNPLPGRLSYSRLARDISLVANTISYSAEVVNAVLILTGAWLPHVCEVDGSTSDSPNTRPEFAWWSPCIAMCNPYPRPIFFVSILPKEVFSA